MESKMFAFTVNLLSLCILASVLQCTGGPIHEEREGHHRHRRDAPTLNDRTGCGPDEEWPPTRVNTTQRLIDLRAAMADVGVDAFLIFSDDAHGSEYQADIDKRRAFISGFTGSQGYAAVTMTKAALWTDGRYFLEAEDALDCNWIFMKYGQRGVPTPSQWLISELTENQTAGADPFLVTNRQWQSMEKDFTAANVTLKQVFNNPVDVAWTDQPPPPETPINALDVKYAGRTWQDKVGDVRQAMEDMKIHGACIVTSLDETAWLFNLRANDIEYNPFFISYAIVEYYGESNVNNKVSLYIYDKNTRLTANPTDPETKDKLHVHMNTNQDGTCNGKTGMCVEVREYSSSQVLADITGLASASSDNKIWVTDVCNFAIFDAIPESQRVQARSYIALAKALKNPTERQGMQNCYNRDSAVLVEFFAKMENEVTSGKKWTELSAADELQRMRGEADKNRGPSFETIGGSGPNAAVIHYRPTPETDRQLTIDEVYLVDSGGQYLDGTTDITRTVFYGTPTDYMKECYTRVLMGTIDLAKVVWPQGLYGRELYLEARAPIWAAGLDYNHGTGHGVGFYLSIHEGPGFIGRSRGTFYAQEELLPNMYFSDEPGFYEPGKFGFRLETILMVEHADTKHKFEDKQFLHFKPMSLIPFEPKMIDYTLLSPQQVEWLNSFHQLTQDTMEPLLTTDLAKDWLRHRTKPYLTPTPTCTASHSRLTFTSVVLGLAAALTLLV